MSASPRPRLWQESDAADGPAFRLGYRPHLDGLRALAVLAVLAVHITPRSVPGGWVGVDVFLVLSGFLITALLLQEWRQDGSISLKNFYLRRALRLLPALVALLLVTWLYAKTCLSIEERELTRRGIYSALGYYANYRVSQRYDGRDLLPHTWSLSLEEQFYLVWPALLYLLLRLRLSRRLMLGTVVSGIAASAGWRAWFWHAAHKFPSAFMHIDVRADTLLVGCLVAMLASWGLLPRSRAWRAGSKIAAAAAFGFLMWVCTHQDSQADPLYYGGLTLIAAAAGLVLVAVLDAPQGWWAAWLAWPPLVWLGRLSYSLYLWHYLVFLTVPRYCFHGGTPLWLYLAVLFDVAVSVAALSYFFVERPFLRWKDRWARKPADVAPPAIRRAA